MSKPLLILSTPRSGSTWIYSILAQYLFKTKRVKGLHEFFSQLGYHVYEENGDLDFKWKWILTHEFQPFEFNLGEAERRLELLKKNHGRYFFKLFPGHLHLAGVRWLAENYDAIAWERKDLFQHFLSFSISVKTGKWYQRGGFKISPGTVPYDRSVLDGFIENHWGYHILKKTLKPEKVLFYEDFAPEFSWEKLISASGFTPSEQIDLSKVSDRQNPENKLDLFENPDLVISEWKNSPLQEIHAL